MRRPARLRSLLVAALTCPRFEVEVHEEPPICTASPGLAMPVLAVVGIAVTSWFSVPLAVSLLAVLVVALSRREDRDVSELRGELVAAVIGRRSHAGVRRPRWRDAVRINELHRQVEPRLERLDDELTDDRLRKNVFAFRRKV